MMGTLAEAAVSPRGVERVAGGLVGWCAPEILRAVAENGLRDEPHAVAAAEATFMRSLEMARAQKALSWELRTVTSLARLWRDHGRRRDARRLLSDTYDRFDEGLATADLIAARMLVDELG
jgi:predicted ATPase